MKRVRFFHAELQGGMQILLKHSQQFLMDGEAAPVKWCGSSVEVMDLNHDSLGYSLRLKFAEEICYLYEMVESVCKGLSTLDRDGTVVTPTRVDVVCLTEVKLR